MHIHDDDKAVVEAGYKPQLKRSLGMFGSEQISVGFAEHGGRIFETGSVNPKTNVWLPAPVPSLLRHSIPAAPLKGRLTVCGAPL